MTRSLVLARYSMGSAALFGAAVVSSSPLTVLVGGIPTMVALGVAGVPLAYALVMVVLWLLMVGYVAVSRHVPHGAPFYAQLARGMNPTAGLVGAGLAFVGYNALQISLYGLIGNTVVGLAGGTWQVWALVAWLLVMALGQFPGRKVARVLGVLLGLEICVIGGFIAAGLSNPADGSLSLAVFTPARLMVPAAVAGVLVFAVASFAGLESVLAYAEEAKTFKALAGAAMASVVFCGVVYALAAWAFESWLGLDQLGTAGADGSNPLALMGGMWGPGIAALATVLLVTSVLAAQVSFHGTVARYAFALAREGVLPARWASVSSGIKGGAPLGGSALQSGVAAMVVCGFLLGRAGPMTMFTWLSTIGAVCVLLLLTLASWSALRFFEKGLGGHEPVWKRQWAPFAGGTIGILALVVMVSSLGTLLNTEPGSLRPLLIALPITGVTVIAVCTGGVLRGRRRQVYDGISYGVPDPLLVRDDRLAAVEL